MKITSKTFTRRSVAIPAGVVIAAAAIFGGIGIGNATRQATPTPTSTPVAFVIPADMPVNAAPVVADPETYDQVIADIAAKKAAADAQAAADAAAAQAAADAAVKAASGRKSSANETSGPVRCPAGSQVTSSDGTNDTGCLPDHCFPSNDPQTQPECATPFKP